MNSAKLNIKITEEENNKISSFLKGLNIAFFDRYSQKEYYHFSDVKGFLADLTLSADVLYNGKYIMADVELNKHNKNSLYRGYCVSELKILFPDNVMFSFENSFYGCVTIRQEDGEYVINSNIYLPFICAALKVVDSIASTVVESVDDTLTEVIEAVEVIECVKPVFSINNLLLENKNYNFGIIITNNKTRFKIINSSDFNFDKCVVFIKNNNEDADLICNELNCLDTKMSTRLKAIPNAEWKDCMFENAWAETFGKIEYKPAY